MFPNRIVVLLCVLAVRQTLDTASPSSPDYKYITYDSYMDLIARIKKSRFFNTVFRVVDDGFKKYDVKPVPTCTSFGRKVPCQNPIIEIGNFHKGDDFVDRLPTALLIAGFHGDEVVGTNSFYYLIELIMEKYAVDPFYSSLLDNVHIVMVPMANVNGFNRRSREEINVIDGREKSSDPNRDFPYDPDPALRCFKTSTSLLLDAVFRKHLVVGCLTFHGGDNSVTYPWGNYPHESNPKSGDHIAFDSVAKMLRDAGWNNPSMNVQTYNIGTMQDVVYNVRGGFEDWAYGGSFDTSNLSKNCGVYDNPSVGLYKDDIKYDKISNRAFVYLVEAGYSKIPDERFLGNAVPLQTGDFSQGKWGHLTRNINLAIRFTQTIRPHAVVLNLSYSDALTAEVAVYGCTTIDEVTSSTPGFSVLKKTEEKKKNLWLLSLRFGIQAGLTKSLSFSVKCDRKFAEKTGSESPQSHLVKLRTLPNYTIDYNNKKLRSYPSIDVTVLNVRTDRLQSGLIHWLPNNINSLTYHNTLKTLIPDTRKDIHEVLHVSYAAQKVSVTASTGSSLTTPKTLRIRADGSQKKFTAVSERHLVDFSSIQPSDASMQFFLGLAGHDADVYEHGANEPLFTSTLTFDLTTPEDEDLSAMFIPSVGLNCRSSLHAATPFFAQVSQQDKKVVSQFFVPSNDYFTYQIGDFGGDLVLNGQVTWDGQTFYRYTSSQTWTELDDLRLLMRKFRVSKSSKTMFECTMVVGEPALLTQQVTPAVATPVRPEATKNPAYDVVKLISIGLTVFIAIGMFYLVLRKCLASKTSDGVLTVVGSRSFEQIQI